MSFIKSVKSLECRVQNEDQRHVSLRAFHPALRIPRFLPVFVLCGRWRTMRNWLAELKLNERISEVRLRALRFDATAFAR
jgi:hypothetical protein